MPIFNSVFQRELDCTFYQPKFIRSVASDQTLVLRLKKQRTLQGHAGCVNACSFNEGGDLLITGSDDTYLILWKWEEGREQLRIRPGHRNNIFQGQFVPQSNDHTIVSCGADGEVRIVFLHEGGEPVSNLMARHIGRAHKLAHVHDTPAVLLSSGEDGFVMLFDLRVSTRSPIKTARVKRKRTGRSGMDVMELNAIHVNPARPWQLAAAGSDHFTRIFDIRQPGTWGSDTTAADEYGRGSWTLDLKPVAEVVATDMEGSDPTSHHITGCKFSRAGELLVTYSDENIYLFHPPGSSLPRPERRPSPADSDHDVPTRRDHRDSEPDPSGPEPSGSRESTRSGRRSSKRLSRPSSEREGQQSTQQEASTSGATCSSDWVEVQCYQGHRNSQTVKGVSFVGSHEDYVGSGSDCGCVFIWSKHSGELLAMRPADSHVVNVVEPHPWLPLTIATSGIENDVRIWEPTSSEAVSIGPAEQKLLKENRESMWMPNRDRHHIIRRLDVETLLAIAARAGIFMVDTDEEGGDEGEDEEMEDASEGEEEGEHARNQEGASTSLGSSDLTRRRLQERRQQRERQSGRERRTEKSDEEGDRGEGEEGESEGERRRLRRTGSGSGRRRDDNNDEDDDDGPRRARVPPRMRRRNLDSEVCHVS